MNDPRHGVPSASGMYRLANCPPSFEMERGRKGTSSDDAASGTRIHKALETGDFSDLSLSEQETANMCMAQMQRVVTDWLGSHEDSADASFHELRLGLTTAGATVKVGDFPHQYLVTGQADYIGLQDASSIIIDYKTGRGEYDDAASNDQLRTLAVLTARHFRLTSVRVVLIQPWAGKPTVADFGPGALSEARHWLMHVLTNAAQSTPADRRAGDWCQYCKALDVCEVARNKALEPIETMALTLPTDPETARAALFARAMELPAASLAGLHRGLRLVGWYTAAIEGAARLRAVDDVEFQQYYTLEKTPGNREITDAQAAFNALLPLGITAEDALAACTMSIGDIEEAARKASGIKSQTDKRTTYNLTAKDAKNAVNEALEAAGVIKRKADKVTLKPVELEITE